MPQTLAPSQLKSVEISFYDHEIYADDRLIAKITHDDNDFVTQRWVVEVNGTEVFRHDTKARCDRFICTHYKDGSLPVQQPETPATTTGNEVICEVAQQCEIFGLELLDQGIYRDDQRLGLVGYTDGHWWYICYSSVHQQKVTSLRNAILALSNLPPAPCDDLLDKPFEELTVEEWQRLQEFVAA